MKKIISILLAVCFLMSVTAAAVSAHECKECKEKEHHGHWEHHKEHRHHHKDKDHPSDWDEVIIVTVYVDN